MLELYGVQLHWLGHAGFKIKGRRVVYIDPFQIPTDAEKADLILITHNHFDHCSTEDIAKIVAAHTTIICATDCLSSVTRVGHVMDIKPMTPGQSLTVMDITIQAFPAYNTNKDFHPKTNEWISYLISLNGVSIFHAGDTDLIPEMAKITCDIALLPVSGTYVMTAQEAAQAAKSIKAKAYIPMHYGSIIGTREDAEEFAGLIQNAHIMDRS